MRRLAALALLIHFFLAWSVRAETPPKPIAVPFELLKSKHMTVMVKINGKGPYRVIFDTGAPLNVISNKIARESGMIDRDAKQPPITLFGAFGPTPIKVLEVGGAKAENVPAVVMDHPAVTAMSQAVGPIDGIVGFPFFARFRMTLDYQAREMTFVPSGYEPPDILQSLITMLASRKKLGPRVVAPAAQWGMLVGKDTDDEDPSVIVREVFPEGAAAQAGLKPGDRLLTLDGRWTDTTADCYHAASRIPAGRAALAVIRRDGKQLQITVKPRAGL